MNIKLNDNLFITSDEHNFIVNEKFIVQKEGAKNFGKEYSRPLSFHPTLDKLIDSLFNRTLRRSDAKGLKDLQYEISLWASDIKDALGETK